MCYSKLYILLLLFCSINSILYMCIILYTASLQATPRLNLTTADQLPLSETEVALQEISEVQVLYYYILLYNLSIYYVYYTYYTTLYYTTLCILYYTYYSIYTIYTYILYHTSSMYCTLSKTILCTIQYIMNYITLYLFFFYIDKHLLILLL